MKDTFFVFVDDPNNRGWYGGYKMFFKDGEIFTINSYQWIFPEFNRGKFEPEPFNRYEGFVGVRENRSICISPGGKYLVFPRGASGYGSAVEICLLNMETSEVEKIFPRKVDVNLNTYSFEQASSLFNNTRAFFRWVSPTKIIYSTSGDLLNQGTWIYDVESKEVLKISSFISEKFLVFEASNFILFKANERLYRVNSDGTNLEEMASIGKVNKYTEIEKLLN